jgi:hypothetical protein
MAKSLKQLRDRRAQLVKRIEEDTAVLAQIDDEITALAARIRVSEGDDVEFQQIRTGLVLRGKVLGTNAGMLKVVVGQGYEAETYGIRAGQVLRRL